VGLPLGKEIRMNRRRRRISVAAAAAVVSALFAGPGRAQEMMGTDVLLKDARFRAGFAAALGASAKERWIAALSNSGPVIEVRADGETWLQATPCKPHDCAENNLLLLYSRTSGDVTGVLHAKGRHAPVGSPSPALAAAMEKMWKKEFRQQ